MPSLTTLQLPLTSSQLDDLNAWLSTLSPQDILKWAVDHCPNLYQSTAFGLTGLAATDMLSKIAPNSQPPLIFIDTLYHFPETVELKNDVAQRYNVSVHVYRPWDLETPKELESIYGERLWETDEDTYDYLVKVEPAQRAYQELNVQVLITGRRASQGALRSTLLPLELTTTGLLKLNPFYAWTFAQVKSYIDENKVPTNKLLSQGYKSVGDWHSTEKSGEGDAGERAGRWKGKEKTECGLHKDYFKYKKHVSETLGDTLVKSETQALQSAKV